MIAAVLAQQPYPGFEAPDPAHEFNPTPIWEFTLAGIEFAITRITLINWLAVIVVLGFFIAASRKPKVVPGKLQFAGESVYGFVRGSIARDVIGPEGIKFAPYLATFFVFVFANNVMGIIPFAQVAPTAKFAIPLFLAIIVYVWYIGLGIMRQGFFTYFKNLVYIPGVPWPLHFMLIPIEIFQKLLSRPFTLAVRLFANMFAGHLLLVVFALGGIYMASQPHLTLKLLSPFSFALAIAMAFFELLVQFLQAYVFTLLAATYLQESVSDGH
ncbi:F0F1 ATP synthase subunit A [Cumulibacter soli]|uniref:F0F1 ATP synthase subunit A n=1 Tax=Cumulibacter soli TaxID=2546344 RepID=UPI001ABB0C88|nr:F0F1 ATP synthase subunit A [Cumulibacter soli]